MEAVALNWKQAVLGLALVTAVLAVPVASAEPGWYDCQGRTLVDGDGIETKAPRVGPGAAGILGGPCVGAWYVGPDVEGMTCTQAEWGVHTSHAGVGGAHGCHFMVWAKPDFVRIEIQGSG